jgi:hypothetical protein
MVRKRTTGDRAPPPSPVNAGSEERKQQCDREPIGAGHMNLRYLYYEGKQKCHIIAPVKRQDDFQGSSSIWMPFQVKEGTRIPDSGTQQVDVLLDGREVWGKEMRGQFPAKLVRMKREAMKGDGFAGAVV